MKNLAHSVAAVPSLILLPMQFYTSEIVVTMHLSSLLLQKDMLPSMFI